MDPEIQNTKYTNLVNAAEKLFWKFGIKRITVDEICREANISKMTFYKFFDNKIELAKYILLAKMNQSMDKYRDIMDSDIPFSKKVELSVQLKMEQTENLSQEFLTDIYRNPYPELLELVDSLRKEFLHEILNDYIRAQESGELRKDLRPEFIIYFLNHMFEMAKDKELISLYPDAQKLIMELTNFFFFGIMPRTDA